MLLAFSFWQVALNYDHMKPSLVLVELSLDKKYSKIKIEGREGLPYLFNFYIKVMTSELKVPTKFIISSTEIYQFFSSIFLVTGSSELWSYEAISRTCGIVLRQKVGK